MTHRFKVFVALFLVGVATATAQVSRTVMVNSNSGIILYPTNFWTVNALGARAGLGLGTAALSNASAFQPASGVLSNFATSPVLQIGNGGTGATNASGVRSNLGLGAPWLTNTNSTNFLTALGVSDDDFTGFISARPWLTNSNTSGLRSAIGLGATWLTNNNVANFRTAIGYNNTPDEGGAAVQSAIGIWDSILEETALYVQDGDPIVSRPANWRSSLNLSLPALTNTNVTNFRTAIGLGATNTTEFRSVLVGYGINQDYGLRFDEDGIIFVSAGQETPAIEFFDAAGPSAQTRFLWPISFRTNEPLTIATSRANLGLPLPALTNTNNANFLSALGVGTNSSPTFSNVSVTNLLVTGNFTNQGTIYGLKTNVGPFEGIGNFFASNNTTLSNETLFRVGLAEQNNRSAQFGFRVARTNNGGEGLAVFSVYGYNALMMIGPSDRSRTNTATNAGIEADIWSISPNDKVMTLIATNTGAMTMHRPIGFNTNTNAPANTGSVAGWIEFYVGTNSVRVPYYQ